MQAMERLQVGLTTGLLVLPTATVAAPIFYRHFAVRYGDIDNTMMAFDPAQFQLNAWRNL